MRKQFNKKKNSVAEPISQYLCQLLITLHTERAQQQSMWVNQWIHKRLQLPNYIIIIFFTSCYLLSVVVV